MATELEILIDQFREEKRLLEEQIDECIKQSFFAEAHHLWMALSEVSKKITTLNVLAHEYDDHH